MQIVRLSCVNVLVSTRNQRSAEEDIFPSKVVRRIFFQQQSNLLPLGPNQISASVDYMQNRISQCLIYLILCIVVRQLLYTFELIYGTRRFPTMCRLQHDFLIRSKTKHNCYLLCWGVNYHYTTLKAGTAPTKVGPFVVDNHSYIHLIIFGFRQRADSKIAIGKEGKVASRKRLPEDSSNKPRHVHYSPIFNCRMRRSDTLGCYETAIVFVGKTHHLLLYILLST